jgi:uncharacterized protein (DUF983 family)
MLTGACGLCHKTMSFEDHLAGMTVRCKQCGQGWVRVPAAASVTASVLGVADKGPAMPPETAVTDHPPLAAPRVAGHQYSATPPNAAVTDQRPAPPRAPLSHEAPTAAACPRCGSASFKRLKAERGATLTIDRECKECGARYMAIPAPMSNADKTAMYVSGVVLILGGVLGLVLALAAMQESAPTHFSSTPLFGVFISIIAGFGLLRTPQRMQEQREKRLKEYQASGPADAPAPVEIPAPPSMVSMSLLFGILSLVAPLVSSLLVVVVFGPAAVVCGLAATAQGHLKGLIGLGLGAAGLAVWGSLFYFLFQG